VCGVTQVVQMCIRLVCHGEFSIFEFPCFDFFDPPALGFRVGGASGTPLSVDTRDKILIDHLQVLEGEARDAAYFSG